MNFTISAPEGTTNHGNPKLICTPTQWYDIIVFFLANYAAHAATAVPLAGQGPVSASYAVFHALMFPSNAILRATEAIARRAATETENPLKRAARAGALCMVMKKPETDIWAKRLRKIRKQYQPVQDAESGNSTTAQEDLTPADGSSSHQQKTPGEYKGDIVSAVECMDEGSIGCWWEAPQGYQPVTDGSQVHGEYWLHQKYYLAVVPPNAELSLLSDTADGGAELTDDPSLIHSEAMLSSTHNLLKLCISLVQAMWAVATVYRARGNQIDQYGYAAFGLTVVPYALMSILNTVANMLTPEYPALFVIRTPTMLEAECEGKALFTGAISVELQEINTNALPSRGFWNRLGQKLDRKFLNKGDAEVVRGSVTVTGFFISSIPLIVVGCISGFQKGNSTAVERGFTMSWLVTGTLLAMVPGLADLSDGVGLIMSDSSKDATLRKNSWEAALRTAWAFLFFCIGVLLVTGIPAVGGMVVVGKMISNYGVCTLL